MWSNDPTYQVGRLGVDGELLLLQILQSHTSALGSCRDARCRVERQATVQVALESASSYLECDLHGGLRL